jgi:hypothetical protein
MSAPHVVILGCGPAGLLAAYAVEQAGGQPVILSRRVKSELPGAQYLHEPIPGLVQEPEGLIRTAKLGTSAVYAEKVYGDANASVSWDLQPAAREAWDLRRVYDELWARYGDSVVDRNVVPRDILHLELTYPLVISSIPAYCLCKYHTLASPHSFEASAVDVVLYSAAAENTVLYDGRPNSMMTRTASIFGHGTTEFSRHYSGKEIEYAVFPDEQWSRSIRMEAVKAVKVIGNNCDCHPRIVRVGRFGRWDKSYLSHSAYFAWAVRGNHPRPVPSRCRLP